MYTWEFGDLIWWDMVGNRAAGIPIYALPTESGHRSEDDKKKDTNGIRMMLRLMIAIKNMAELITTSKAR